MIRLLVALLLLPATASAFEHEIELLDAHGNPSVEDCDPLTTCGACHSIDLTEPHGPHGPHAVTTGKGCLGCHHDGELPEPVDGVYTIDLRSPYPSDCGTCHMTVVDDPDEPFFFPPDPSLKSSHETGAVFAPGRIPRSGMNVAARDSLARAWDVHAERLVNCTDCHSLSLAAPVCTDCHATEGTHAFLDEPATHLARLACEACHVPAQYGPTLANVDRTVPGPDGKPQLRYRGIDGDPASPRTLVHGYRPVLLPATDEAGNTKLAPFNLVTEWAWYDGNEPVAQESLDEAFLVEGEPHPVLFAALDATGDGEITDLERAIFSPHQVDRLAARLKEVGVGDPEIHGTIRRVGTHHGIAEGRWATRDCGTCHGDAASVTAEFWLADYAPAGILPEPVEGSVLAGEVSLSACGHVVFHADPEQAGFSLQGTGPGSGLGGILRIGGLLLVALVALGFGTGPMLRTFHRKNTNPTEGAR